MEQSYAKVGSLSNTRLTATTAAAAAAATFSLTAAATIAAAATAGLTAEELLDLLCRRFVLVDDRAFKVECLSCQRMVEVHDYNIFAHLQY